MTNNHNIITSRLRVTRSVREQTDSGPWCVVLRVVRSASKTAVRDLFELLGLKVVRVNTSNIPVKRRIRSRITKRKSAKKVHVKLNNFNNSWDSTLGGQNYDNIL